MYIKSNQKRTRNHFWSTQPCRPGRCINRDQQSKSIFGAAIYHQRGVAVYQQQSKTKANAFLDDTTLSTRAVYQPRELYINSNRKLKRKHFWSTQPYRPGRCINRPQQSKYICGAAVYHQRGIAVYQQQPKTKAKVLLDDTAVSTWAVYQPPSAEQKHVWRSCISPARCNCTSTVIKTESKSTSGRHSHVDPSGINRDQQSKNISGATVYHQRGISTAVSKAKAYLSCTSTAIKNESENTSGRHSHVDLGGISTAISKARAYGADVYHQRGIAVYQQQSKLKAKAFLDNTAVSTRAVYQPQDLHINSNRN